MFTDEEIDEAAFFAAFLDEFGASMSIEDLAKLGQRMRDSQRKYFRSDKSRAALETARDLERQFDKACVEVLSQPTLFAREAPREPGW